MTEERKLVTVLFADIVGSTAIGLEHDPEVVRATLERAFEAVRAILVEHGGTVEKFIGDAVMAIFGIPSVHEDDADRAVRAAFALRERMVTIEGPIALQVRVGVSTGEVVAASGGRDQLLATGTPIVAAGRLQTAADPGEILVGPLTHALTTSLIRYGTSRSVVAKGLGSVEAWPALASESELPEARRGIGPRHSPLIGREREMRLLADAFTRTQSTREVSVVTLLGPAGIGKSRLVAEFIARLEHQVSRVGRSLPYGEGVTFYPLVQIVRIECGIEPTDDHAAVLAKIHACCRALFVDPGEADAIAARVAAAADFAPVREVLPSISDASVADELRYGVRRFLEQRALREPLILVFEDLQWAERPMVELIEHIAEFARAPILLLCLARPEFRDRHRHFASEAANAVAITLTPLSADETDQLASNLLVEESFPADLRRTVVERAEGNPLYVEEFLRLLIETNDVVRADIGNGAASESVVELGIPPTLLGLVAARLDRAPPEVKRLLQVASIAGRIISAGGIDALSGTPVSSDLIRDALRRDLLAESTEAAVGRGPTYRFKHLITRDVAYGMISKAERGRLHERYAAWLREALGDRRDEAADAIAFHAERAFALSRELGEGDSGSRGDIALDSLLASATLARQRGNEPMALTMYTRASEVARSFESPPRKRIEALGFRAFLEHARSTEKTPAVHGELVRVLELAREFGPSELLLNLLYAVGFIAASEGRSDEARLQLDRLMAIAGRADDPELAAGAMTRCAQLHYFLGDLDRRLQTLEAALVYMRQHHVSRQLVWCLNALAISRSRVGAYAAGQSCFEEAERLRDSWTKVDAQDYAFCRTVVAHDVDDLAETERWATEASRLAREIGRGQTHALASMHLATVLLRQGRFAEALERMTPVAARFENMQQRQFIPESRARLAIAAIGLGDIETARAHVVAARAAMLPRDPESAAITGIAEALLAEAEDRLSDAERCFRETLSAVDCYGMPWRNLAQTQVYFGGFLSRQGRHDEARAVLDVARHFYRDPLAFRQVQRIDELLSAGRVPKTNASDLRPSIPSRRAGHSNG